MDDARSFLNRRWTLRTTSAPFREELAQTTGYSPYVAKLLAARGIQTADEAEAYLDPGLHRLTDPNLIHQMELAVTRVASAIQRGERICIYGDYDVDGQTSVALLVRVLGALGGRVFAYVPNRLEEGYGLNVEALAKVRADGATLVLTVDCGITSVAEAQWAREHDLDLVITDHHQPGQDLPDAIALVNPKLGAPEALHDLAGAGVAFKFAEALCETLGAGRAIAHQYVELAAVGTVADVVPLRGENRSIVRAGLDRLNRDSQVPGLMALKDVARIEGDVTVGHVGFGLGPRLNAAGRIADASVGVRLLTIDTFDEALPIAERLDQENEERRRIERRIAEEADRFVLERCDVERDRALVAWGEGWHTGVIGIVASRIVERYYRPTVILSIEGELVRGSGRSIPGLNLYEALADCKELFEAFGGHEGAAGLTLRKSNLDAFQTRFQEAVERRVDPSMLVPTLEYDDTIDVRDLSLELIEEIGRLAPFGVGNPSPVFVTPGVSLRARPVGRDGSHLKVTASSPDGKFNVDGIGFGISDKVSPKLEAGRLYDVAFVPEINAWNGRRSPSMQVKDIRLAARERKEGAEPFRAAGEIAASGESAVRETIGPGFGQGQIAVRPKSDPPHGWNVVDCRGGRPRQVLESLARAGRPAYVIPGPEGERVAYEIAAMGYDERTVVVGEAATARSPRKVEQAFDHAAWIAVVVDPPGPWAIQQVGKVVAKSEAGVGVVLWDLPLDVRELTIHSEALRSMGASLDFYLAFKPRGEDERLEWYARRFPDRDRLGRLYVAIKNEIGAGEAFTIRQAYDAVARKWPEVIAPEGVRRAIDVFGELGLVEPVSEGYRLSPSPGAKVDLEQSLRYNEFTRIRGRLARSQRELEEAQADRFFSRLWEISREIEASPPWAV